MILEAGDWGELPWRSPQRKKVVSRMDEQNTAEQEKKKMSVGREILSWVIYLLIVVALTYFILHFVGQRTMVDGNSMYPTLEDGDNLIVEKLSYRFGEPQRFDIIVFPYDDHTYYIKRIIGLPGETVQIDEEGNIYIDGEILEEDYGAEVISNPGRAAQPVQLGEDEYFVMGDNRNNSKDSRTEEVGNIHRDDIVGRAWVRIWPLDQIGFLKHQ